MNSLARISILLLACCWSTLWGGPSVGQNSAAASSPNDTAGWQAVTALEQRWLSNENDPSIVDSILADDFVHVLPEGLISKQDHIGFLKAHPHAFPGKKNFQDLQVRIYGDVAIANGAVLTMSEEHSVRKTFFTDVFVHRGGRWQAVNAQETPAATNSKK